MLPCREKLAVLHHSDEKNASEWRKIANIRGPGVANEGSATALADIRCRQMLWCGVGHNKRSAGLL